jgi:hypothetical protein
MGDLMHFFWIAFREYWVTWVTGTGLAGFTLWAINYISDRVRKKPMKLRINIAILFCFLWFLATYSAWHDADKNLEFVKRQRADDTGKLAICTGDLKAQSARADVLDTQLHTAQTTAIEAQKTINTAQNTANSCVSSLAKIAVGEPPRTYVYMVGIATLQKQPVLTEIVLVTNKAMQLHGNLKCPDNFDVLDWTLASGGARMGVGIHQISPREYHFDTSSPLWEPHVPAVVNVLSSSTLRGCTFTQKQY